MNTIPAHTPPNPELPRKFGQFLVEQEAVVSELFDLIRRLTGKDPPSPRKAREREKG